MNAVEAEFRTRLSLPHRAADDAGVMQSFIEQLQVETDFLKDGSVDARVFNTILYYAYLATLPIAAHQTVNLYRATTDDAVKRMILKTVYDARKLRSVWRSDVAQFDTLDELMDECKGYF